MVNATASCPMTSLPVRISPEVPVWPQQRVDAVDDPAEEASVQRLAHGVPHLRRLLHRVGPDDGLPPRHHAVGGQGLLELIRADAQQRRHWRSTEGSTVSVGGAGPPPASASPFSRTETLTMLLLSVWCSEATGENSTSPALRMAARVL